MGRLIINTTSLAKDVDLLQGGLLNSTLIPDGGNDPTIGIERFMNSSYSTIYTAETVNSGTTGPIAVTVQPTLTTYSQQYFYYPYGDLSAMNYEGFAYIACNTSTNTTAKDFVADVTSYTIPGFLNIKGMLYRHNRVKEYAFGGNTNSGTGDNPDTWEYEVPKLKVLRVAFGNERYGCQNKFPKLTDLYLPDSITNVLENTFDRKCYPKLEAIHMSDYLWNFLQQKYPEHCNYSNLGEPKFYEIPVVKPVFES